MAPTKRNRSALKTWLDPVAIFNFLQDLIFQYKNFWVVALSLLLAEIVVNVAVIWKIPYTEIDWKAYMDEVEGFLNGTLDYTKLEGGTGPLVYPAGFVYIFSGLYYLTDHGENIKLGQYFFCGLYLVFISVIFYIHYKSQRVPPYAMFFLCCASYRIHSIFVLRLFNDPIAMLLFYIALIYFINQKWTTGCILFSLAVSVKMNVLLFAPGLAVLMLYQLGMVKMLANIIICGLIQLALGLPFLLDNAVGYMARSFNLGRQFFYKWTVNWRLIPEWLFLSRWFHLTLLILHLSLLFYFMFKRWPQPGNGWINKVLQIFQSDNKAAESKLSTNDIIYVLFTSNFIGMMCSRSLHYQFYVWYFHTLPFILWSIRMPSALRLLILGVIEMCWNTYPSTVISSSMLHAAHLLILLGLIFRGTEDISKSQKSK
ncbi:dol-P-Man:Man(5)GlcNAc(2)-PP-Dol alpha-1,3-mannosyltransferase-like [Clytia hemisphaerica]|uniref:dolichyl-P-Man:Man5GlcNAc2-PP-dolichol alpha-1,3-mannosyltransferase n=1 Tax=Clytia hemisphaerica TaxID=252671 RepID=A0A7M5VCH5_9CNID